ncbi:MAG: hypothetical protein NVS2B16_34970 [Chloroflexota bacterium]
MQSLATLQAIAGPSGLRITGSHFIPHSRLALVAYPTFGSRRYIVLGTADSNTHGTFRFHSGQQLTPGQYVLRAFSQSTLAAQMAQTFFEVEQ